MSQYLNPFPQHFISTGVPAAFYKVFFGEPNQDPKAFPKAPFSDSSLKVEIATTQTLNDSGSYQSDIFLDGAYSIRIETPLGSLWRESPTFSGVFNSAIFDALTAQAMIADTTLNVGDFVFTVGYNSAGDGGDNSYEIVAGGTGTDDGGSFIDLDNGNQAKGLFSEGNYNVKQWNATGDGVTDDTIAISNAINFVLGGGKLHFPAGTYVRTAGFNKTPTGNIEITCDPGVVIDDTGNPDFNSFRFQSTKEASKALSSNANEGENFIMIADVIGLSINDVISINSSDNFVPETVENLGSGEFAEIQSISGTTLTLKGALMDDYVAANTTVSKVNAHSLTIRGLEIQRNIDNGSGIYAYHLKDVLLEDCKITGAKERSIWIRNVLRADVNRCQSSADYTGAVSTNYGIAIDGGQYVNVRGGSYRAGRHGIKIGAAGTLGNGEQLISRYITISDNCEVSNDITNGGTWALDSHDPVDYVSVLNCKVTNGIGLQARNNIAYGNSVYHGSETGAFNTMLYFWPYTSGGVSIAEKNKLYQTGGASVVGLRFNLGTALINNLTYDTVLFRDNYTNDVDTGLGIVPWTSTGTKLRSLNIEGNSIINPATLAIECIPFANPNTFTIDSVNVQDNPLIQGKSTFNQVSVTTNVNNNTMSGLNAFNRNDFAVTGNLEITDNTITGYTSSDGLFVNSKYVDLQYVADNTHLNNTGNVALGLPRIAAISGRQAVGVIAYSSSEPDYGLWTVNDTVYESSPTSGSFIGWIVTTAGYGIRGAWATPVSYSVGEQTTNGGNLYRAVTSGTSGATPPTHTSGEASDGGVTWEFISSSFTQAVFTTFGAIT